MASAQKLRYILEMLQLDAVKPIALLAAGWMEVLSGREIQVVHLSDGHSLPPGTMQTHFFFHIWEQLLQGSSAPFFLQRNLEEGY